MHLLWPFVFSLLLNTLYILYYPAGSIEKSSIIFMNSGDITIYNHPPNHQSRSLQFNLAGPQMLLPEVFNSQANIWYINFTDHSTAKISSRVHFDNVTEYSLYWPISDGNLQHSICFYYGSDNGFWTSAVAPGQSDALFNSEVSLKEWTPMLASDNSFLGPLIENIYLHSSGFAVVLDDLHLWYVKHQPNIYNNKENLFCFTTTATTSSAFTASDYITHKDEYLAIKLNIFSSTNLQSVHQFVMRHYIRRPSQSSENIFSRPVIPISSLKYLNHGNEINNVTIMHYIDEISANLNDERFLLHFDEVTKWSNELQPPFTFDTTRFTLQPEVFLGQLKEQTNYTIAASIHPTVGKTWLRYQSDHSLSQSFFLPTEEDQMQNLINFSQTKAVNWFIDQLSQLVKSIDGLTLESFTKFEAYITVIQASDTEIMGKYTNFFMTKYISSAFIACPNIFSTTAYKLQALPIVLPIKSSQLLFTYHSDEQKTNSNGLYDMLPRLWTASLAGYPYVMPHIDHYQSSSKPTTKWFNRWLKLAVFMPLMHVPFWPSAENSQNTELLKNLLIFRKQSILPLLQTLSTKWIKFGEPLIRPMWYAAESEEEAKQLHSIDDQFYLGENLIVTPFWDIRSDNRTVTLPKGVWYDPNGVAMQGTFFTIQEKDQLVWYFTKKG